MSRSELILDLANAGMRGDASGLRRTVRALSAEAKAKQQHTLAKRYDSLIEGRDMMSSRNVANIIPEKARGLVHVVQPRRRLRDIVLPTQVENEIRDVLYEHSRADLLRSHSLEPRHSMLLQGPPGTGKTSLAEALAAELGLLFLVVRYDAIIGSYLGETAGRLNDLLEFASSTPCLLFFDEFDAIGKERGDIHETGEIKRVVSSLLMQIDSLPEHVFIVCATNHPELLDRAVWRRFEIHIEMPLPTKAQIQRWFRELAREYDEQSFVGLSELSDLFTGRSFSDLEQFTLEVRRRIVLGQSATYQESIRSILKKWSSRLRAARPGKKKNGSRAADPDSSPSTDGDS